MSMDADAPFASRVRPRGPGDPPGGPAALVTLPAVALGDPRLHHADVVVLAAASWLAGGGPRCLASDEEIGAETAHISPKAVARAPGRLEAAGYVCIEADSGRPAGRAIRLPWRRCPE